MIFESLDAGEVENHKHEKQIPQRPSRRCDHQTSFFAHEVFEYFLPAQKVFCLAGKGGEAKDDNVTNKTSPQGSEQNLKTLE